MWDVDPRARIVHAEPAINVVPRSHRSKDIIAARRYTLLQFEALDFLLGRSKPKLGGRPEYVDIVGVNYYLHNQWRDGDLPISVDDPDYHPFRDLLAALYERYKRPLLVAETGIEGDLRPAWLRIMCHELALARGSGVPVEGMCLYPILDYPGWEDERHCPTGLFGSLDAGGRRPLHEPLGEELRLTRSGRAIGGHVNGMSPA